MQQTKLPPFVIFFNQSEEFHHLKNEIFTHNAYYFETENPAPRIIDAGAHIGLATLYFKKLFPLAHVRAIEPNPAVIGVLQKNLEENQVQDVKFHQVALADKAGTKTFFFDRSAHNWQSTASFTDGAWNHTQESASTEVPTVPLAQFLTEEIDFLKMDIEGAEQEVLLACGSLIRQVKHMLVEFHPGKHQSLEKICQFLKENGFSIELWQDGKSVEMYPKKGLTYIEAKRRSNHKK